jgi:hypothetical protein
MLYENCISICFSYEAAEFSCNLPMAETRVSIGLGVENLRMDMHVETPLNMLSLLFDFSEFTTYTKYYLCNQILHQNEQSNEHLLMIPKIFKWKRLLGETWIIPQFLPFSISF